MKVTRAARAGFCMGVSLALKKLEQALAANSGGRRICTLGPIIHNPQALAHFESQGVVCLDNCGNAQDNDFVLIRAHGVPRKEEDALRTVAAGVEDATCPKVKKAQLAISEASSGGATLLLFGDATHPEVRGLVSYAHGEAHVFSSDAELNELPLPPDQEYALAAQTTQDRELFNNIAARLAALLPRLQIINTICDATHLRQAEAREIAEKVDVMIVVGGKESGNTKRLANLARQAGIPAYHIERTEELEDLNLDPNLVAGLTAGASTPRSAIDEAEAWLLHHGRNRQ